MNSSTEINFSIDQLMAPTVGSPDPVAESRLANAAKNTYFIDEKNEVLRQVLDHQAAHFSAACEKALHRANCRAQSPEHGVISMQLLFVRLDRQVLITKHRVKKNEVAPLIQRICLVRKFFIMELVNLTAFTEPEIYNLLNIEVTKTITRIIWNKKYNSNQMLQDYAQLMEEKQHPQTTTNTPPLHQETQVA